MLCLPANRTKTGQFLKGQSGNPSGRPKRSEAERDALAAICGLSGLAVSTLEGIMQDEAAPPAIRLKAAQVVLDRICGTPMNLKQIEDNEAEVRFEWG